MRVHLENIAFNHDKDLSKTGAFYLRRNETQIVRVPEWRRECCSNPECAPAGYVIANLPQVLTIKASFVCDDPKVTSVFIQALEPADGINVLGHVAAKEVTLTDGRADLVPFDLSRARTRIKDAGISASNITWKWQFSRNSKEWTNFQRTRHRIYTVLEIPTSPWEPKSDNQSNIHVPWTDVLDYACQWAMAVKEEDLDEAATKVTHNLYELGKQKLVRWDGSPSYTSTTTFNCTAFLDLLGRGIGKGQTLNCNDCATIVSTFSNVLGCSLWQSGMGLSFRTHPILLIGKDDWLGERFARHEVAWKNDCGHSDALFDACLQVDGDGRPASTDRYHEPLQPTNLIFTSKEDGSYKFCLVRKGKCEPRRDKKRRKFGRGSAGERRITDEDFLTFLEGHYKFNEWKDLTISKEGLLTPTYFDDLRTFGDAFDGWNKENVHRYEGPEFSSITEVLLSHGQEQPQQLVEITVFETAAVVKASDFLLQLLGHCESLDVQRMKDPPLGDVSFVTPDAVTVFFRRGAFVASIRSVGVRPTEVILMAVAINNSLAPP